MEASAQGGRVSDHLSLCKDISLFAPIVPSSAETTNLRCHVHASISEAVDIPAVRMCFSFPLHPLWAPRKLLFPTPRSCEILLRATQCCLLL